MDLTSPSTPLLAADEPAPVIVRNADGVSPFFLTCDHYGRMIPRALGDLGIDESERARHIAYDIGIAGVAEAVSDSLRAHLIAQRYSRLVIDCNRPLSAASSIPPISEATTIPGNQGLTQQAAFERQQRIFAPYHHAITEALDQRAKTQRPTILVSLHSFTPIYAGVARPWHIGTLYNRDHRLPKAMLRELRSEAALVIGDNQPYAVSDTTDYTIPVHGERRGLINTGIEIRQDLITDDNGQREWAERLVRILRKLESELLALI
ncbi:MAG: N-formylglutamate amidohydrolase [Rhizobiales bacterium]|nr:N-formylglutamate amidohydrolase [Hyphomicrobiales bacterium]